MDTYKIFSLHVLLNLEILFCENYNFFETNNSIKYTILINKNFNFFMKNNLQILNFPENFNEISLNLKGITQKSSLTNSVNTKFYLQN